MSKKKETDLVPKQPSDFSYNRLERVRETNPRYSFEYLFEHYDIESAPIEVDEYLSEHNIYFEEFVGQTHWLTDGSYVLAIGYSEGSEGEVNVRVSGDILAFLEYPDLIEVLTSGESPVEYKGAEVTRGLSKEVETPYPMRFEFLYEHPAFPHFRGKPILEWINKQDTVKFLDENKFIEPGDDHPTFIRVRETSEGKLVLMLEGYSIEGAELLDHLRDEESPFEFQRSYVVGRKFEDIPKKGDSK